VWRAFYEHAEPQSLGVVSTLPFEGLDGLKLLLLLRSIRPDKVTAAAQDYVVHNLGADYVKPPLFDLTACYQESSCTTPLIFILSPGSDPMRAVLKAAEVSYYYYCYNYQYCNCYYCQFWW
jgi:dynein heavy chain, axonemal